MSLTQTEVAEKRGISRALRRRCTAALARVASDPPVIATFLIKQAGLKRSEADTGAMTLIKPLRLGANLNIPLHCLVLDGVYRTKEGVPGAASSLTSDPLSWRAGNPRTKLRAAIVPTPANAPEHAADHAQGARAPPRSAARRLDLFQVA